MGLFCRRFLRLLEDEIFFGELSLFDVVRVALPKVLFRKSVTKAAPGARKREISLKDPFLVGFGGGEILTSSLVVVLVDAAFVRRKISLTEDDLTPRPPFLARLLPRAFLRLLLSFLAVARKSVIGAEDDGFGRFAACDAAAIPVKLV